MIRVTKPDLPSLKEYTRYLRGIWKTHWVTNDGVFFRQFEKKVGQYLKAKEFVCVSHGTIALQFAIMALNQKQSKPKQLFWVRTRK